MLMDLSFIGYVAAICSTTAFLPQVIKTWKTKQTKDISLPMYIILVAGTILWFVYGILLKDTAIYLANGVILILASSILYLKIKNG